MDLGAFSVSLAVKDIEASKLFYEKLGFTVFGGDQSQNWLILKNGQHVIGLFQGMERLSGGYAVSPSNSSLSEKHPWQPRKLSGKKVAANSVFLPHSCEPGQRPQAPISSRRAQCCVDRIGESTLSTFEATE
jgi:hypothetical protein